MNRIVMELLPASLLIAGIMLWHTGAPAQDSNPVRVVTTTPELAKFVQDVGGPNVVAVSLMGSDSVSGELTLEQVTPLLSAEILVLRGESGEMEWVDRLVRNTPNRLIQRNGRGRLHLGSPEHGSEPDREAMRGVVTPLQSSIHGLNPTRVARVIAGKLGAARPELADSFLSRVSP